MKLKDLILATMQKDDLGLACWRLGLTVPARGRASDLRKALAGARPATPVGPASGSYSFQMSTRGRKTPMRISLSSVGKTRYERHDLLRLSPVK